jgi:hypothetical protein
MKQTVRLTDDLIQFDGAVRWALAALSIGVVGWAATVLIAATTEHGLERFFRSYLVAFMFFLSLALGALFFVLIGHLTRSGWNVVLRRVAEVVSESLAPLTVFAFLLFLGRHELYEWTHLEVVATDELLQHKRAYLNANFFFVRLLGYFAVWSATAWYFSRTSREQDRSGAPEATLRMERFAAPAMIFYAMTLTFASFDFLMSLYPHWYSTIYPVYYFSGCVLGAFSLITLLVAALQSAGRLVHVVTAEHFHDLGKLMFAFVVFWAYCGFSQYMLIWYAHIPEETGWYLVRQQGVWLVLSLLLLLGHFFLPFLWLISRHPKRRRPVLAAAAVWLLAMHWFDLYWLVMPEFSAGRLPFHLLDLSCMVGFGGLFFAWIFWRLSLASLVPVGDPRLAESLGHENG